MGQHTRTMNWRCLPLLMLVLHAWCEPADPQEMGMDDLLSPQPQEVSVHDLIALGDAKDDEQLAIRNIYQSARVEQHERDMAKLRALVKGPLHHRCWCSTKVKTKSTAEIEEANKAAKEADHQLAKEKREDAKVKQEENHPGLGEGAAHTRCSACRDKKTELALKLRAAQLQAQ